MYEGYLRENNPTGDKINFRNGAIATYDFSDDLRRFQWGVQLGADWKAFKHLKVYADLNWGANEIFKKDFETISFDMYTVYLNVGFGYTVLTFSEITPQRSIFPNVLGLFTKRARHIQ